MSFRTLLPLIIFLFLNADVSAQSGDVVYMENIKTARLHPYGNQQRLPVLVLGENARLELGFDDLEGGVKSYYYSYVLCDYNWQPVSLSPFDYIKGFTQNRIATYRNSSIALTRYTHYQAILPDRASVPTRSGNYIVKVFLDGDTSKLAFTKRMVVVDPKATMSAEVVQPFTPQQFNTHQKLRFTAMIKGLNSFSAAQQVKVVILQNNRWDNAQKDITPTFVRGNSLEFNSENIGVFPGGKEWRWMDLRSFRLQSDRIDSGYYGKTQTILYTKPDLDRNGQRYIYYPDLNGNFEVTTYESINPYWQGDYATVNFRFVPEENLANMEVYLAGQLTEYKLTDEWKMKPDPASGFLQLPVFLKQGYYNYTYIAKDPATGEMRDLEGNYWETENNYTILLYYKGFTDRNDLLLGIAEINSRTDRPGLPF